jgi:phage baseplate assembly protein V
MTARSEGLRELALPDMERRLANAIRYGKVMEVDLAKRRVRIESGDLQSNWIPWPAGRAGAGKIRWDAPEVGEQGMMISPGGDMSQATFIPGIYQDSHDAPVSDPNKDHTAYGDGTVLEYDRGSHTLLVDLTGGVSVTANRNKIELKIGSTTLTLEAGKTTLVAPQLMVQSPTTTFTGTVLVQGLLTYSAGLAGSGGGGAVMTGPITQTGGNVSTGGGTLTNNGVNVGSTHTHNGVQTGSGSTGGPA